MSDGLWSMITVVSLVAWISAGIVFLFKAFPERGRFEAREARKWGVVLLAAYAVWVIGLLNA